ncbi:hypothetical protein [Oscillibacter valericigenes]|nr:hypothetical protein [Oscillibacter valericigenes]
MSEFSPILGGNEGYGAGDDVKQDVGRGLGHGKSRKIRTNISIAK